MSVTVLLPGALREMADGRGRVTVEGDRATVREALAALRSAHPGVYRSLITETGELRPHVNIFVGRDDIRWSGGLDTPLQSGAELVVLPAVSGG